MPKSSTGMIIDGVFASQAIDSSGEILDIEGCDISTLDKDGIANYEHKEGDKKGTGNNGEEIVGKILYARKIFKQSDCDSDRERKYWDQVKVPFVYGMVRLYDGAGHSGAQALAAQIRDHAANGEPILVRFSIEGSTLERDGQRLKSSVARRVALTLKPCNRTAVSGLIEDPRAPEGFEKKPAAESKVDDILAGLVEKGEVLEHPAYMKLGGAHEVECSPLVEEDQIAKSLKLLIKARVLKALTAGSYGVAPGSLTGGAALQVEDRGLRARMKRAVSEYKPEKGFNKGEFKAFAKTFLPEADDSFMDHFADVAHDYHMRRMKKAEELEKKESDKKQEKVAAPKKTANQKPAGKAKAPAIVYPAPEPGIPVRGDKPRPPVLLTVRGKPVPPPATNKVHFDEEQGVLHVPPMKGRWAEKVDDDTGEKFQEWNPGHNGGQFPMYIPGRDAPEHARSFNNLLEHDPDINNFHDYAMENWAKMNEHFRNGTLPPEVIMHAALFAQLSPNTPVPMQELMYGHLVDSMKEHGINATKPEFAGLRRDWLGRDKANQLPQTSPEHWARLGDQIRISEDSKKAKRSPGELMSFMLANNKFDNMAKYHQLHDQLVQLVSKHKGDARAAAAELMHHKYEAKKTDSRIKSAQRKGKEPEAPYSAGPAVAGLAPKTARYMLGMIGGGNVQVPDTHFTRYLFGLEKGKGAPIDNHSIEVIKSALWKAQHGHVLDAIDRYYAKHHDAVRHMLNHPKYGHLFKSPEEAIFPAFWKNWVSIVPHEAARGMYTGGENEGTDHRVFWDNTVPLLKGELSLPARTAMIHNHWVQRYGEVPAMMLYYHKLVPMLLGQHATRTAETTIRKFEALTIDLKKAIADEQKQAESPEQQSVMFAGQPVVPGRALTARREYALLHEGEDHYVAVPKEHAADWCHHHLVRLPKAKQNTHYTVTRRPMAHVADLG